MLSYSPASQHHSQIRLNRLTVFRVFQGCSISHAIDLHFQKTTANHQTSVR